MFKIKSFSSLLDMRLVDCILLMYGSTPVVKFADESTTDSEGKRSALTPPAYRLL